MKTYKKVFIALWTVAALLMILIGLQEVRKSADNQNASKLNAASNAITDYARAQKKLPDSLAEIKQQDTDGLTYKKLSDTSYELCTTFITDEPGRPRSDTPSQIYVYAHDKGYQCFKAEPTSLKTATRKTSNTGSVTVRARDTERQTDIKNVHAQLEAYYAQNGKYPSLTELNDINFRASNMKGLDTQWLKDPAGPAATLLASPSGNYYSYQATASNGTACGSNGKACSSYTLTAVLEAGGTYFKKSLN